MSESLQELQHIVADISEKYSPDKIILFGSLASGNVSESSDIDLLIIKKTTENPWQRSRRVNSLFKHTVPIDLLVYTPEEIDFRIEMKDFFIMDIMSHGKVLYERGI